MGIRPLFSWFMCSNIIYFLGSISQQPHTSSEAWFWFITPQILGFYWTYPHLPFTFLLADSIDSQSTRILTEENPHTMITTDQGIVDFSKIHRIMVYDKVGREYIKYFSKFPTFTKIAYKLKTVSNTMTFNHSKDVNINWNLSLKHLALF